MDDEGFDGVFFEVLSELSLIFSVVVSISIPNFLIHFKKYLKFNVAGTDVSNVLTTMIVQLIHNNER